ncbi:MAG: permease [Rhizobiaceae bacterium]
MMQPAGVVSLARHEMRLSWRDFMAMMTAGRKSREKAVVIFTVAGAIMLHAIAWVMTSGTPTHPSTDRMDLLVFVSALMVLPFSLMTSQAMESVTRIFYSRSDLDLVLSSPVSQQKLFLVKLLAIAASTALLSVLLASPLINVLVFTDSFAWLAAYPVLLAAGVISTLISLLLTLFLFATIGARRTRLIAQIVAAVVGASFIIGIQLAAISSMGTLSRIAYLTSNAVREHLPESTSFVWYPARAVTGEMLPLALLLAATALLFFATISGLSASLAERVLAAAGVAITGKIKAHSGRKFRHQSMAGALRHKEWKLLRRDHWLISQTLMQIFYLVPPAFMLWHGFGSAGAVPTVVVPVLVMAAGQLSGGLAWLAISGEDAPQLVATAPVTPNMVLRAKIEAVLGAMAIGIGPILVFMAFIDPRAALVAFAAIIAASLSAIMIQLWFRSQAKRSSFRRRQTSSRVATFAEAFSSILWAGCAAFWANGSWMAIWLAGCCMLVLFIARNMRPDASEAFQG